jgi:NAD(P)-dependent dehydrogenase (short-subunit alcohol dehydrogenase family)
MKMDQKSSISLVTGATSMLGRKVAERLIAEGNTVRAVIRATPKASDEWRMLPAGVVPYVADITLKDPSQEEAGVHRRLKHLPHSGGDVQLPEHLRLPDRL